MRTMPLPEWSGPVVVHRDDAVTCVSDTCPRDLALGTWWSLHSSFVTCRPDDYPHCRFDAPVQLGHGDSNPTSSAARRSRGRPPRICSLPPPLVHEEYVSSFAGWALMTNVTEDRLLAVHVNVMQTGSPGAPHRRKPPTKCRPQS